MSANDLVDITSLTAAQAIAAVREGRTSAEDLVRGCLARIHADEPRVQAWAFIDEQRALEQARNVDRVRREGHAIGPLHGLPVGVKDIIDTADMPTEDGTVPHAGRRPEYDATVVERLRSAGAIILGKTVTAELATYTPGKTRNPHNPEHTPGGSSSGIGGGGGRANGAGGDRYPDQRQRDHRPAASICGVYGYKPTFGLAPRDGILKQSQAARPGGVLRAHGRRPGDRWPSR